MGDTDIEKLVEFYSESVLGCCVTPIKAKDIMDEVGIPKDDLGIVLNSLLGTDRIETHNSYYFTPSEDNWTRAKVFSLPNTAKMMYYKLLEPPGKTISQIKRIPELKGKNINYFLESIRSRGLLIERDMAPGSGSWLNKVYSVKPVQHPIEDDTGDKDAAEPAVETPRAGAESGAGAVPRARAGTKTATAPSGAPAQPYRARPPRIRRASRRTDWDVKGPNTIERLRAAKNRLPAQPQIPEGPDDELWVGKGDNYRDWIDNNRGYGPGFVSNDLLNALLEHDIRVSEFKEHGIYADDNFKDKMLRFMHAERVIKVYKK